MYSNDTDYLKETFQYACDTYEESQREAQECRDMYTNRQYTQEQINLLNSRGQPVETFNVVLMMTRALSGYLGKVQNRPQIKPRTLESNDVANALNDYTNYVLDSNDYDSIKRKLQLDGLTSGLMVQYVDVVQTGQKDKYGRDIHNIVLDYVPSYQTAMDPMSKLDDHSDFRFFHRFKWISKDNFRQLYGTKKLNEQQANTDYLNRDQTDKDIYFNKWGYSGVYQANDKYLVVHSIVREQNGEYYSVQWCDTTILQRHKITNKILKNPYITVQMNDELDMTEFYGPFREVIESQKAINQALVQIQLLINTSKAFIEDGAVEDVDKFKEAFSRVNSVVVVDDLDGIKIEDLSRDILNQYAAIDKGLERIKMLLGINDSFLGTAFASDSGRKVQIQANHSAGMISYVTGKIEVLMRRTGYAITQLARQYISAEQVLRTTDQFVGDRYFMINQPVMEPLVDQQGNVIKDPATGQPVMQPVMEPLVDPDSGEYVINQQTGAIALAPLGDPSSTLEYADVDIKVESVAYDNTNERDQALLETVVNGPIGQAMLQMDPAAYMMSSSLSLRNYGAKYSNAISDILQGMALKISGGQLDPSLAMVGGNMQAIMGGAMGGSSGSAENQPQGGGQPQQQVTNEGVSNGG